MIRKAVLQDIDQIENSYTELLLYEKDHVAYTVWKLGVYPTQQTALQALQEDTLYVMEENGEICASIIVNNIQPDEYKKINWKYQVKNHEVLVIHLLCVRPSCAGRGIGKAMVQFVINKAKQENYQAVRLDTGLQNKPAIALYTKLGFELAGTTSMSIGGIIAHDHHLFFEIKI